MKKFKYLRPRICFGNYSGFIQLWDYEEKLVFINWF